MLEYVVIALAHYSLFVTVRKHRQNHFFKKKIDFGKRDENTSIHYSSSTEVFLETENILYYSEKSTLCLSRDHLLRRMCFMKKFSEKWSWITMNHSLHTIYNSHNFRLFVSFCCCLRIVCSELLTEKLASPENFSRAQKLIFSYTSGIKNQY